MKYLISGGGTGGHIFPAVSIANALKELDPGCDILFVGALGRMEMERVPQAGYKIVGLPVQGFNRQKPWKNVRVLINMIRSMRMVKQIIRDFKPNVGIGVGGYASGAAMKQAAKMGIPILLQEQNGFAGVTNKLLKDDAQKICVAYEGMERFFPKEKIILTGNPVRQNLTQGTREEGFAYCNKEFNADLDPTRKTVLVIGGSLGARTINHAMINGLQALKDNRVNVIWQTGKNNYEDCKKAYDKVFPEGGASGIICTDFLSRMELAYAVADVVISRAGASSISELCLLGKPSILVPSPNVAEDHQTHNAMALVRKDAAILVKDVEANEQLIPTLINTVNDEALCQRLHTNILALAQTDSARRIAEEVIKIAKK
jgi:UDP-N-acetylglucosamine--N-acetylmuramyl-(pentapeptide) pyrophosphoryl-undecaprenol N-acetylglucosamine transferase